MMAASWPVEDREAAYPRLIELGIALSAEHNHNRLLEKILLGAKEMTNADGGTLSSSATVAASCALRSCATTRWGSRWAAQPARRSRSHRSRSASLMVR